MSSRFIRAVAGLVSLIRKGGKNAFSWSGIQSRILTAFSCHASLVPLNKEQLLSLSLMFMLQILLEGAGQLFCKTPLSLICLVFPHNEIQVVHFGNIGSLCCNHIRANCWQFFSLLVVLTLVTQLRWWPGFSTVKLQFSLL